ncbi:hypothetical protein ACS0TY_035067 [Phlomoides rotata]
MGELTSLGTQHNTDSEIITLTTRQLDDVVAKAVEDALAARGITTDLLRAQEKEIARGPERVHVSSHVPSRGDDASRGGRRHVEESHTFHGYQEKDQEREAKPPSLVDRDPTPRGGTRNPEAMAQNGRVQDMEENADHAPPPVTNDQLEALKKKKIETMRWRMDNPVSNSRPITGHQFTDEILQDELYFNFKPLNYEYDGTTNPYEHLMQFENSVILHRYGEGPKCRVFLTTLAKSAQQ